MPLTEARLLFQDAVQKYYLDSILSIREDRIVNLEEEKNQISTDYERLLKNAQEVDEQQSGRLDNMYKIIDSYKNQLKSQKKRTLWANIKFYSALAGMAIITYIAVKT